MSRLFLVAITVGAAQLLGSAVHAQTKPTVFYVAVVGDDSWSGTLASPNRNMTDGPFATFERARDAIRQLKSKGANTAGGVKVMLRGTTYSFSHTLRLSSEDSGTSDSPIEWTAYPGETVTIAGSKDVTGFRQILDPDILKRIDPPYRDKILVTNLREQGISNFGTIVQRGSPGLELFFNGQRMTVARWPNTGWLRIADVPQKGDSLFNKGLDREKRYDGVPVGRHYGRITYEGDRPKRWSPDNEIYLHGYWTWDWSDSFQKVRSIDTSKREIILQSPHHWYGYTKNQR